MSALGNGRGAIEILVLLGAVAALIRPLGAYLARVFSGERIPFLGRWLGPVERAIYRALGTSPEREMTAREIAVALLASNAAGFALLYALLRLQGILPANPQGLPGLPAHTAWNVAMSFVTNTNWQSYSGEAALSYLTQMVGLTTQNFLSAASGLAVLAAVVRGFARRGTDRLGNFWVDATRSILYVLLPLSLVLALALAGQGVVQSFSPYATVHTLEGTSQTLALGPAASQIAIKQLGTNGGGFYNANSAHPFENPTPLSNALELIAILALPAGLCATFGRMVGDRRQGRALLAAMTILFLPFLGLALAAETAGNPAFDRLGVDQQAGALQEAGNLEGKEVRFGVPAAALWATATTAASNGSVNAMHDSFTPLGGLAPTVLILLGEVSFGGVGSGLYGMLLFAVLGVFSAGLMVGRTPEYLGKKIEPYEMKMACFGVLLPCIATLVGLALAVATKAGTAGISNPGPHGFSELLYGFASAANNNGSAFAGLSANAPFYNLTLGIAMFLGRYGVALPALAVAGALARKRTVPAGPGTLPTHTPLFVFLLAAVVVVVAALTFLPALALGPIAEHVQLFSAAR
ncbi:MAG TPA: potassium-transporting ATPase subunit KdpA [Thermoanaerobaculia bacterium]|nr:potassium-transporting ATPase subunit KdpA [Thermoanaerobaculia bacterium]